MVNPRRRLTILIATALLAAGVPLLIVTACGPYFEPEVFTPTAHPESLKIFATGHLGILQPGYWQADKIVAYRYLVGGHLSPAEQAIYNPPEPPISSLDWQAKQQALEAQSPTNRWTVARAELTSQALLTKPSSDRTIEIQRQGYVERDNQLNCTDGAFDTATDTLRSRAKIWGPQSATLKDWIVAQDAVFSNCTQSGDIPQPAPANAPLLLKQDRAYQLAAAHFYATQYDQAMVGFESIAQDKSSPWSKWGEYLVARTEIRKAAFIAPATDWGQQAEFDPALMQSARNRLQQVAQTSDPQIHHAALAELSFVNVRLEPQQHLNEEATALAGPNPDPDFSRDLNDLRFLADHNVTGDTDLLRWVGLGGNTDPLQQWKSTHSAPWLLSAIAAAKPNTPESPSLTAAVASLPVDSPAYPTANYHRTNLLLQSGQAEQARQLATTLLAALNGDGMAGSRNAVLALRMLTAPSFNTFLEDAPRHTVGSDVPSQAAINLLCGDRPETTGCLKQIPTTQFDQDAAASFNLEIPLSLWVEAAASTSPLPPHLRQSVAWAAWVRALGLNDDATAKLLAPLLPPSVLASAGYSTGFPATLAMLRNPGLRPYLDQGVQRSASYRQLDEFRDNWWCQKWGDGPNLASGHPLPIAGPKLTPAFLTPAQQDAAKTQAATLNQLPNGVSWLGRRAIDYVKAHPEDPDAAESLALTVRATRYGCYQPPEKDAPQKAVSKEAFEILHKQYPKSPWTAKTAYYY
jgi:hypothetical protein